MNEIGKTEDIPKKHRQRSRKKRTGHVEAIYFKVVEDQNRSTKEKQRKRYVK